MFRSGALTSPSFNSLTGVANQAVNLILVLLLLTIISPARLSANNENASTEGYKKQYTFTTNWFAGRIPSWTKILKEFKGGPNINYLEIGAFEGRSALWLLENILTHPTSKITVVDTFGARDSYQTFISNITLSGEASKFKILVGHSTEKLRELPLNVIDIAYIDGSVKGIVILSDLVNTWNLVKTGGIIICNQYSLDNGLRKVFELEPNDPGPHEAIEAFLKLYKPYIQVLALEENQVIFRKIRQ